MVLCSSAELPSAGRCGCCAALGRCPAKDISGGRSPRTARAKRSALAAALMPGTTAECGIWKACALICRCVLTCCSAAGHDNAHSCTMLAARPQQQKVGPHYRGTSRHVRSGTRRYSFNGSYHFCEVRLSFATTNECGGPAFRLGKKCSLSKRY